MYSTETVQRAINFFKIVNDAGLCDDCITKIKEQLKFSRMTSPTSTEQDTTTLHNQTQFADAKG